MTHNGHTSTYGVAVSVLHSYFPVVATLRDYLQTTLDDYGQCLHTANDSNAPRFEALLDTSYVASSVRFDDTKRFTPMPPMCHMRDVSGGGLASAPDLADISPRL